MQVQGPNNTALLHPPDHQVIMLRDFNAFKPYDCLPTLQEFSKCPAYPLFVTKPCLKLQPMRKSVHNIIYGVWTINSLTDAVIQF